MKKIFTKKKKNKNQKNKPEENKIKTRKSLKTKETKKYKIEKKEKREEQEKEVKKVKEEKEYQEDKEEKEYQEEKDEEENEKKEISVYSISSINDEDDAILENMQIKNEVDIMNLLISNNDSKNVFNWIYDLKQDLRKKDKSEKDKKIIKENKNQIREVVDKYFYNLISKLTVNSIKKENIHLKVFNEMELIKKYGIYTRKDLNRLIKKSLEERYDNEDEKYNRFYYYDEYDEYFKNKGEKKVKIMKKSHSQELVSKKIKFKKFMKFDDLKTKIKKKKKKELIYNNAYLFKDNNSDNDEQNNFIIRKEIQEILNKEYNEMIKAKKEEIVKERKRKNKEYFLKKKVPFRKKSVKRRIIKIIDDSIDEPIQKKNINTEANLREIEKEKERDKKLYEFFGKIQHLKKRSSLNQEKLNKFIDEQIEERYRNKNHQRLFQFLEDFNLNRAVARNYNKSNIKRIGYISPIIFTSPNEGSNISNIMNLK